MKKISIELKDGTVAEVNKPDNCNHPRVYPPLDCMAIHHEKPECDCRWCTHNKEYGKANSK